MPPGIHSLLPVPPSHPRLQHARYSIPYFFKCVAVWGRVVCLGGMDGRLWHGLQP